MTRYSYDEVYTSTLNYFNGDELAAVSWMRKYAMRNYDGDFAERDPDDMHRRMAKEFTRIEKKYNFSGDYSNFSKYGKSRKPLAEDDIYNYFKQFRYIIPQGSVM